MDSGGAGSLAAGGESGCGAKRRADAGTPPTREAIHQSFAPIVKKAAPAVVNVYSRRVVRTNRRCSTTRFSAACSALSSSASAFRASAC